jgi:VDE lipocalin domain
MSPVKCSSSRSRRPTILVLLLACIWHQSGDAFQGLLVRRIPASIATGSRRTAQRSIHSSSTNLSAVSTSRSSSSQQGETDDDPTLVILVPSNGQDRRASNFGTQSPVESPSLLEAAHHLAYKSSIFCDGRLQTHVFPCTDDEHMQTITRNADIVLAYGLDDAGELQVARSVFAARRQTSSNGNTICQMCIDCAESLPELVGPYDASSMTSTLSAAVLPWSHVASGRRLHEKMTDLFQRGTTDDFCGAIVLFLNRFVTPIDWVRYSTAATWEKGVVQNAQELYNLATICGDCLGPCVQDTSCRTCLTKLTQVDPRDQALSYRTIVSYESDLLTKFSLCAFTKHNVFQCAATIPTIPAVPPLTTWRDQPITEEVARSLLVGHLSGEESAPSGTVPSDVSWKVACGANVAYDQFPCQNQLFYPSSSSSGGKTNKLMWYDPVFRVQTLDGRNIWCKRHYRVRQLDENPATFRLSVSDNGVTSDEFWTIVGAADDLSWIVFHYAGAAKAVGLRYLGGLLCTPDGNMPKAADLPAIWQCFRTAGIQPWELYVVDNRVDTADAMDAGPPPLTFYRQAVMELRQKKTATALS